MTTNSEEDSQIDIHQVIAYELKITVQNDSLVYDLLYTSSKNSGNSSTHHLLY